MKLINTIKYTNLEVLTNKEKEELKEILIKDFEKISRLLKNDFNILVHIKLLNKEKKRKYSIHIKLESPTKMFVANVADWDLKTIVHKATNKIKNEIEKSIKTPNRFNLLKIKKLKRIFSMIRRK